MKLLKWIVFAVVLVLCGATWWMYNKKNDDTELSKVDEDNFIEYRSGKAGDDPLYGEEVESFSARTRAVENRQETFESVISAEIESIRRESKITTDMIQRSLDNLTANIQDISKKPQQQDKESQRKINELTYSVESLTSNLKEVVEQSEAKIKSLEEQLIKSKQEVKSSIESLEKSSNQAIQSQLESILPGRDKVANSESSQSNNQSNIQNKSPVDSTVEEALGKSSTQQNELRNSVDNSATYPFGYIPKQNMESSNGNNGLPDILQRITGGFDQAGDQYYGSIETGLYGNRKPTKSAQKQQWPTVFPVYTLPPTTTLANALSITPIIGRVPIDSSGVNDPFFFRVEIGKDNLAANGHVIPGVQKMLASGYAVGIREQSCTRGYIDTMTFIFSDGRISTVGGKSNGGISSSNALGYLADKWSKPCIRGDYINNADDYLTDRVAAASLEALASAYANSEVTYDREDDGGYYAYVDGNSYQYALGEGMSGAAAEIADYVRERAANAFDVVYVPQAQNVQIVIDQEIAIDYDANARMVNYYPNNGSRSSLD